MVPTYKIKYSKKRHFLTERNFCKGRFFIARHKLQKRTTPRILKISGNFFLHVIEKEI